MVCWITTAFVSFRCYSPMLSVFSFAPRVIRRHSIVSLGRTGSVVVLRPLSSSPSSSADATTEADSSEPAPRKTVKVNSNTGGLRRLPVVKPPNEMINTASRLIRQIKPDPEMKNMRQRARKHGAETLNKLCEELCVPLRDAVSGYKAEWRKFHPFERVVADLSVRAREQKDGVTLQGLLDEIHEARKMVREASKDWIAKVKAAETAKEARETMEEGVEALKSLFEQFASKPVSSLVEIQRALRSSPMVALDTPAVVLIGAPNVGKSSIVRRVSSGTPEVNNYPFTTRGMTLGHVEVFWTEDNKAARAIIPERFRKKRDLSEDVISGKYSYSQLCQVMDSPGLLNRPDEQRNEMESLTMAAMQHLPTAVMFVLDLSGAAGDKCSSVADQLQLRREVRARFPSRPWIDVVSKIDLGVEEGSLEELEEITGGKSYIKLSVMDDIGVEELKSEVMRVLGEVRLVLDAMADMENR